MKILIIILLKYNMISEEEFDQLVGDAQTMKKKRFIENVKMLG